MFVKLHYLLFCISYVYAISTYILGLILNVTIPLFGFFALILTICIVCFLDTKVNNNKKTGKILKTLIFIIPIILVFKMSNLITMIHHCAMCIFSIYLYKNYDGEMSHYEAVLRFKLCFTFYAGCFLLQMIGVKAGTVYINNSIIMFIIYLYISILFIRVLRDRKHDKIDKVYVCKQIRQLVLFILVTYIITCKQILGKFLRLLATVLNLILTVAINILNKNMALNEIVYKTLEIISKLSPTTAKNSKEVLELNSYMPPVIAKMLTYAIYIILGIFLTKILIEVVKKLLHYENDSNEFDSIEIIREKIKPEKKNKINKSIITTKRDKIRKYYRSFLTTCTDKEILVSISDTTNDISLKYIERCSKENSEYEKQFRNNYMKARYNTKEAVTSEEVKQSKELLSKL